MPGTPLGSAVVTVLRPTRTVKDSYGNDVPDRRTNVRRIELPGCAVQPGVGAEQLATGRDVVTASWRVYAPGAADVLATDQVEYAGVTYEIDGQPRAWPAPWGGTHHTDFSLRAVNG